MMTARGWEFLAMLLALFFFNEQGVSAQEAGTQTKIKTTAAATFLKPNGERTVRFPTNPKNGFGWTMKVQVSPESTADVMRVEIDFTSTLGPTTADEALIVRMEPRPQGHSPPRSPMTVSFPFEIPQGTERIRFARHVPKGSFGNQYQVRLLQNGRELEDCQATIGEPITFPDGAVYQNVFSQNQLSVLWVNSRMDSDSRIDSLKHLYLTSDANPYYTASTPDEWSSQIEQVTVANDPIKVREIDADDLADHWLAYRPFDTIVIHRDDYVTLMEEESAKTRALQSWNQAGGSLIVRGGSVADPAQRIARTQVTEIGSDPSLEALVAAEDLVRERAKDFLRFSKPDDAGFQSEIQYMDFSEDQVRDWKEWFPEAARMITDSLEQCTPSQVISKDGVRAERNLAGMIIHLGKQDADAPVHVLQWRAAVYLMGWKIHRLSRSGVEPILGSARFFQWVIPGVAQPPVYTFMGLLGVFVVLVGPVAYRKTAKSGRSYLMFAIAPVLAIATTLAMLAYGVIADGFGTQTRIRQVTWVDGSTGDAFTRTRSTYFAGIRPSEGMWFPADADVTVYPDNQQRSWESRIDDRFQPQGEVIHDGDTLRLNQDFLPSRQQRQFVVHRPRTNLGRIVVEPNGQSSRDSSDSSRGDSTDTIEIRNEFKQPITELLVCDDKGRYFFIEKAGPGDIASGILLTDKKASERLGEMYKRQWLISSIVERRQNRLSSIRGNGSETFDLLSSQINALDTIAKPSDGVFEFELQMRMQLGSKLPNNSFLCLMGLTEDAIAVEGAVPTESIHFVMGSLP